MVYFKSFAVLFLTSVVIQVSLSLSSGSKDYRALFEAFKTTHGKTYSKLGEEEYRYQIFVANVNKAEQLQKVDRGTAEYGVTKFSDLTAAEFKQQYLGLNTKLGENIAPLPQAVIPDIAIPKNFDWRKKNVVSEVKDQGSCGSCWSFSTTGNIESLYAIKNSSELLSLSEQELLDCDTVDEACNGGLMTSAYKAIISLGGLESESDYPYEALKETCRLKKKKILLTISGGETVSSNEKKMAQYLYKNGPVSIGINADNMQLYKKGIAHPSTTACDPSELDHGVLIVGYGVQKKIPYWIVKNSWGSSWGEKGYYRIYRGDGSCGLNTLVSSALL